MHFEIDARPCVTRYVRKGIECLEQNLSMLSPIGNIIWPFGRPAALGLEFFCLS